MLNELLQSLFGFILAIAILVTVHEFGHFWVARRLGIKVLRFSIGFGKPIWKKTAQDGTEYVIAAIPLGGYVKMLDAREMEVPPEQLALEFNQKPLWIRSAVVIAGPLFNLLLAVGLLWLSYMLGEQGLRTIVGQVEPDSIAAQIGLQPEDKIMAINGHATLTWSQFLYRLAAETASGRNIEFELKDAQGRHKRIHLSYDQIGDLAEIKKPLHYLGIRPDLPVYPAQIDELVPDMPAEKAGLKEGDRIIQANGQPIHSWSEWQEIIENHPGQNIAIEVDRQGQKINLNLVPASVDQNGQTVGRIGVIHRSDPKKWQKYVVYYRYGPVDALRQAWQQTWEIAALSLKVIGRVLTGQASLKNLGGPVTMADIAGQALNAGSMAFIKLLALISIGLGVFNLLPIPMLDGGHLFYFAVEWIRGKPPSEQFIMRSQQFGLAILLSLMALVLYQDLWRLIER